MPKSGKWVLKGMHEFDAEYYGKLLEKAWGEAASLLADAQSCRVFSSNPPTYANFNTTFRNRYR
jgi:hypothetical protein